ncbi:MAG: DUF1887 family protein [Oscillospiraceae bacterium]|nr:DUF1887 family protein [Oscillospiraceae bacterium]
MTIIELFDSNPLENVISFIAFHSQGIERIVYLGEPRQMRETKTGLERYLRSVEPDIETEYRKVDRYNLDNLTEALFDIVDEFGPDKCIFDLTGGDDLVLFAMGMVYERFKDRGVRVHKFNVRSGTVAEHQFGGRETEAPAPMLTVEENILLHGGKVVTLEDRKDGTVSWDFSQDFVEDMEKMGAICRTDCGLWNTQLTMIDTLVHAESVAESCDPLLLSMSVNEVKDILSRNGQRYFSGKTFSRLFKAGLLTEYQGGDQMFTIRFKNEQVKTCLSAAGTILELMTCYHARQLVGRRSGKPRYQDAMTGVRIDWDGEIHQIDDAIVDVENEIDVILMSGVIPVFVSCKNGLFNADELYKLNTVAERFGGKYAEKVLVYTSARIKGHVLERAEEMGIQLIGRMHEASFAQFGDKLRRIGNADTGNQN